MNKLPTETRVQILNMLCEGPSIRAINRMTGVSTTTVLKPLVDAGHACGAFHDEHAIGLAGGNRVREQLHAAGLVSR